MHSIGSTVGYAHIQMLSEGAGHITSPCDTLFELFKIRHNISVRLAVGSGD